MKYFGVPVCPYCKKRVNLIRTWSLKRQGEYRCPRCGGISNIFLSPLIYVFALMAVLSAGALYFFHKFVLDDIDLGTVIQVIVPFAIFFLLSLFMVYLERPVIKKIPKAEIDRRRRAEERREARKNGASRQDAQSRERQNGTTNAAAQRNAGRSASSRRPAEQQMFYEEDDYLPKVDYRTGPLPVSVDREMEHTSVVKIPAQAEESAPKVMTLEQVTAPTKIAEEPAPHSARQEVFEIVTPSAAKEEPGKSQPKASADDDFFAKYNDPEYIDRRLRELGEQRNRSE